MHICKLYFSMLMLHCIILRNVFGFFFSCSKRARSYVIFDYLDRKPLKIVFIVQQTEYFVNRMVKIAFEDSGNTVRKLLFNDLLGFPNITGYLFIFSKRKMYT